MRVWKKHPRYDYLISSKGEVYRRKTKRIIRPWRVSHGYLRVEINHERKWINEYVHRLVGETYLKRRPGANQINHINGDKEDNRLENLEWVTARENRAAQKGLKRHKRPVAINGVSYPSIAAAARDWGVSRDVIRYLIAGTMKKKGMEVKSE